MPGGETVSFPVTQVGIAAMLAGFGLRTILKHPGYPSDIPSYCTNGPTKD